VAAGIALRVLWPRGFLFRLDEAVHMEWAARIARDGEWVTHAWPSSVGVPNGPVFAYWLALFARASLSPVLANLSVVAANGIALAAAVPLFRRLLPERRDADLAVALLATSPVAIWFSRKIWDPCLLALFLVPALLLAARVLQSPGRSRAIAGVPVLLALAVQVHQSAIFFGVVLAAVLLSAPRRIAPGWLAAGAAAGMALLAPYASHVVPLAMEGALRAEPGSRWPDVDVITNFLLDASGHNIIQSAGPETARLLLWPAPPLWLLVQIAAVPFYAYLFAGFAEAWRPRSPLPPGARRLILGGALGLPALYLVLRVRGVAHYFLPVLPLLFALIVLGARRLRERRPRWVPPLPALLAVNALSWIGFQSYMSWNRGSEYYGLPYGDVAKVAGAVAQEAATLGKGSPERPLRLRVDVPRDRGDVPEQYRFLLERRLGVGVTAVPPGEPADVEVRIRWPRPPGREPWLLLRR
jgi:4-amino-4-deoxy-L-arabinose transferase-like glycosyltransferase